MQHQNTHRLTSLASKPSGLDEIELDNFKTDLVDLGALLDAAIDQPHPLSQIQVQQILAKLNLLSEVYS